MIKTYFIMFVLLFIFDFTPTSAFAKRSSRNPFQVNRRAHRIVQQLKKEDPRVLRAVMYHMGWVPKLKYKRERRKKQQTQQAFDDWYIDMMRDFGGIPKAR
jgi:hypothetical protein